ncbi:MAG: 23S rRNA (guanosine2251-2'-O)-methyltransferase [Parvicellaceae bacterium]|jgi:23S rRNA (guanosine2251-2'-O)-methyltransferase
MKENLIYGIRSTIEAINSGKEINKVLIQHGTQGELMSELQSLLKEKAIPSQNVPPEKIYKLSRDNHQGVVAFISPIEYGDLETIVNDALEAKKSPLIIILDRITDVRNFGSIARSAECLGVDAIVIPKREAAQVTADAIKTSAGALLKIQICREENLRDVMLMLQQSGVLIVAASEQAETPIHEFDFKVPVAIVMGSEENGVSKDIYKRCDAQIQIPMTGEIASMNVSVSCGIVLYEVNRQRNA